MGTHRLRILACLCSALGVSSVGAAESFIEPSNVHTTAADVASDISTVDLVGYAMDGSTGLSRADDLTISGTIYALGALFPMSDGTLSLYGEFVASDMGGAQGHGGISADGAIARSLAEDRAAPILEFALARATPNPSPGSVRLSWAVPRPSQVRIDVLDVQGRQITVLAAGEHAPGRYDARWNASGRNAPGLYFVRMQTPERVFVRRIVLIP